MKYCEDTRAMLRAYKRETDEQIFQLQRKVYELQSRVFSLELERYFETEYKKKTSKIREKSLHPMHKSTSYLRHII